MSYKIGSFNVRNLSYNADKEKLDHIAKLIKKFDIVALQEVLSNGKILMGADVSDSSGQAAAYGRSLKSRLWDKWDMCWLNPETRSKYYPYLGKDLRGEGYAFLWNTEKFKCPVDEKGKEFRPQIYGHYRVDESKGELRLIRNPGYGRFVPVSLPNAEIRLITTHIVYGKPKEGNLAVEIDHGSAEMRRKEFEVLARKVYTSISKDHNYIDCNIPYTVILGDYNLNLKESNAGGPYVADAVIIDKKNNIIPKEEMQKNGITAINTFQSKLSTVNKDADGYAHNYDHFSYDDNTKDAVVRSLPETLDVVKQTGDLKIYKDKVSDHVPIMLKIDFKKARGIEND